MKEIKAIGLIPFHQSIINYAFKGFCFYGGKHLLCSLQPLRFFNFHNDKKDEKKVVGNACSHVTLPLYHCLLPG